jgi:hypothetical protein
MNTDDKHSDALHDVLAERDIAKLASIYARGLDRVMPDLVRSVFHDDAETDYGSYRGGPDGFVQFAMGFLSSMRSSHHMLGQALVTVEKDSAVGEIYFQAHHRIVDGDEEKDLFVGGRYVDRYALRDGVWKISHRTEVVDWVRQDPDADLWRTAGGGVARGLRSPDDLSCQDGSL